MPGIQVIKFRMDIYIPKCLYCLTNSTKLKKMFQKQYELIPKRICQYTITNKVRSLGKAKSFTRYVRIY